MLDLLWTHFPDERKPQLLRGLHHSIKQGPQRQLITAMAEALPLEERQALLERLLRQLQPHEMEHFVCFLPWIWGDDTPMHSAKLYTELSGPDRARHDKMLQLGTIGPDKSALPPVASEGRHAATVAPAAAVSSTAPVPGASAPATAPKPATATASAATQTEAEQGGASTATSVDALTTEPPLAATLARVQPTEAPLETTPVGLIEPWKGMSPVEGDEPYTVDAHLFLRVSADCYEAALLSMQGPTGRANWAKSIFNMLLRRAGDAKNADKADKKPGKKNKKKGQGGGGAEVPRAKSSLQMAREALFALLRGAQLLAATHPRARLFARLCGVYGASYSEARTERVLRVLSRLFSERAPRVRDEMVKGESTVPMHGVNANVLLVLRSMQGEIGAEHKEAIMAALDSAAQPDPELLPDELQQVAAPADRVVSLDEVLLAVMEQHDAQRAISQRNLRAVFEHFDVNGDGSLDMAEFIGLMEACDQSLGDDQVSSMFLDCTRASKRIDDSLDGDEVNAAAFVEVCEVYGLHMQVQSTVVTEGQNRKRIEQLLERTAPRP